MSVRKAVEKVRKWYDARRTEIVKNKANGNLSRLQKLAEGKKSRRSLWH